MNKLFGETRHVRRPRLEIVPMIDVMLLLLVFYILSTVTLNRQQGIPVNLPKAATGQADATAVPDVTVTIMANGDTYINRVKTNLDDLGKDVKALADRSPGGVKALDDKGVVINADMSVQHGKVVAVMDQLRQIDITHFGIATDSEGANP